MQLATEDEAAADDEVAELWERVEVHSLLDEWSHPQPALLLVICGWDEVVWTDDVEGADELSDFVDDHDLLHD